MEIHFIGPVLFVKDIQAARRFYEEVLELKVDLDFGVNVGYQGGLGLWQEDHAAPIIFQRPGVSPEARHEHAELAFEIAPIDKLYRRLQDAGVEFVHPLIEQPWGQRTVRFYDLDGHLVEAGEPMGAVVGRLLGEGFSAEETARKTGLPLEQVRGMATD